ncbi:hypothetical protein ABVT39_024898 [Epinephelus coioides]
MPFHDTTADLLPEVVFTDIKNPLSSSAATRPDWPLLWQNVTSALPAWNARRAPIQEVNCPVHFSLRNPETSESSKYVSNSTFQQAFPKTCEGTPQRCLATACVSPLQQQQQTGSGCQLCAVKLLSLITNVSAQRLC